MKRVHLLILGAIACLGMASCGVSRTATTPPAATTTMECTQITGDGNFIVEVQCNGRNVDEATESALVYAVRALLFVGIPGSSTNRIQSQKPLIKDAEVIMTKQAYFQNLFDSGDYRLYAETLPNIVPKVVKVNGSYKVTVSIILKKNLLRKRLENDGIIKSLGNTL